MAEATWATTRSQLTDALANIELRVKTAGPTAGKIAAGDMADAILEQLPRLDGDAVTVSRADLRKLLDHCSFNGAAVAEYDRLAATLAGKLPLVPCRCPDACEREH
jgi:hypothetical protein